jgi:hypothetical protein
MPEHGKILCISDPVTSSNHFRHDGAAASNPVQPLHAEQVVFPEYLPKNPVLRGTASQPLFRLVCAHKSTFRKTRSSLRGWLHIMANCQLCDALIITELAN